MTQAPAKGKGRSGVMRRPERMPKAASPQRQGSITPSELDECPTDVCVAGGVVVGGVVPGAVPPVPATAVRGPRPVARVRSSATAIGPSLSAVSAMDRSA